MDMNFRLQGSVSSAVIIVISGWYEGQSLKLTYCVQSD
jgi:hypothetical protein